MEPSVRIAQGALQGKVMTSRSGRSIHAFQGIPYAEPPVGELRFQDPRGAPQWSGVRLAHKEGNFCMQKHYFLQEYVGSEDCLYLNVFTPPRDDSKLFPVMVWIHGGGFFAGSGNTIMYGPEFLLDHDVVLVTINYRLTTLGFLNLGTPEVSGNCGLKDQVAALKWVKNNIQSFGGDPKSVTIFGASAGGASIHYLLISPLAKGLFHKAIVQSGTANNPWAFCEADEAKTLGKEICKQLECCDADSNVDLAKLKAVSGQRCVEEGNALKEKFKLEVELVPSLDAAPNIDTPFFPSHPRQLEVADVPIMIGVTTHEGMLQLDPSRDMEKRYKNSYAKFVPCKKLGIAPDSEQCKQKFRETDSFYDKICNGDFLEKYICINTDINIVCGVDDFVRETASNAKRTQPLYYYQFSYDGALGFMKKKLNIDRAGACHTDELSYLFTRDMTPWREEARDADFKTIDRMTLMWTNFAKLGNPTPDNALPAVWEPVDLKTRNPGDVVTRYLEIGDDLKMCQQSMNQERMKFWRQLLKNKL